MFARSRLALRVEVNIEESDILKLTDVGKDVFKVKDDGSLEIDTKTMHLEEYKRSCRDLTEAKKAAKNNGVDVLRKGGSRDDILEAIATKLEDDDRKEHGEDFRADSEDPDSVIIQAGVANVCTAPSDYTKLVFADVIDELSRKGIVVHTSEKPLDNKGDFEKIITEEPVSSVREATAEICTSRPRFEAKVDYPLHSPDETFPDHITDELYDRFLDWRNEMEWENHSPKGMLQKLLAPINSRHPFADKLKGLHLEAMNHWGGEDNNKYSIVSDELGAGIGVGRESPARIFQKEVDVSPPSDFTKLAFADAIDELSRKGVVIKNTQQPRWIFLATSSSNY
ncbi:hypothetical protein TrLO_g8732 [Triparma laevis f. longispina]|uniref:Uncharacterized protein n=1 Tax=Triparma laevis f. longispina TaxID=1714387 RepID=A0A9W6ZVT5_9STRA|nr:hypothetical protein TrLO_g8732 [Triparma laevis f. longispina]